MSFGALELVVVLGVLLLVVGPAVLPRITRNLGRNVGAFRRGLRDADVRNDVRAVLERDDGPYPGPPSPEGVEPGAEDSAGKASPPPGDRS